MTELLSKPIKDIVTDDHRTAAVFEKHGIDFCCRGGVALEKACGDKGIAVDAIIRELGEATRTAPTDEPRYNEWELDALADHIVSVHHEFIRNAVPTMLAHVNKVAHVHGAHHPEMVRVRDIFSKSADDLLQHTQMEEMILFPMIRAIAEDRRAGRPTTPGMVDGPIRVMMSQHDTAGAEFEEIRALTNNYTLPADGCMTYQVTLQELSAFEQDLHTHVHLENAVLFPRAIAVSF